MTTSRTTPRELLEDAVRELSEAGVPSPQVDAELLLAHVTGRPRALLRLSGDPIPQPQLDGYSDLIRRRRAREPLQHLTGSAPFRYLELAVGPGVFVPRPETELLVDAALAHLRGPVGGADDLQPSDQQPTDLQPTDEQAANRRPADGQSPPVLVDLCAGSGALAISLAVEVPGAHVHAVEIDPAAAGWARRNVVAHAERIAGSGSVLTLHQSDATAAADAGQPLEPLVGQVDVVVTNPPYIPDAAIPRDPEVRDHDPRVALFGGPDGLAVIRLLVAEAARLLRPGGLLLIEHADVQGDAAGPNGVPGVLATAGWAGVADHRDLAGLPRYTSAIRPRASAPAAAGSSGAGSARAGSAGAAASDLGTPPAGGARSAPSRDRT